MSAILFSDALVTFVRDQATNVKHRVRTTGLEHQGQTSISDPIQNLGFTCIFSLGMPEYNFYGLRNDSFWIKKWCQLVS